MLISYSGQSSVQAAELVTPQGTESQTGMKAGVQQSKQEGRQTRLAPSVVQLQERKG